MYRSIIFILMAATVLENCSTDMKTCTQQVAAATIAAVPQTQLAKDVALIDKYLTDNTLNATKDGAMRYIINAPGTGKAPCLESTITVTYSGRLMLGSGAVFDSSAVPVDLPLNGLILGWKLGLLNVGAGANITLYIPSGYAYGPVVQTKIPANSNLIFDINLVSVTN